MNRYEAERIEEIRGHLRDEMEKVIEKARKRKEKGEEEADYTKGCDAGTIRTCMFALGMLRISTFFPNEEEEK